MKTEHLCALLISYCAAGSFLAIMLAARRKDHLGRWGISSASIAVLAAGVAIGSAAMPGRNSIAYVLASLERFDRLPVAAIGAGALCGLLAALAINPGTGVRRQALSLCLHVGVVLLVGLIVLKDAVSPYLAAPDRGSASGALNLAATARGFRIEEYARLDIAPTSLAVGPGRTLYVAGYTGIANQNGVVVRVDRDARSGAIRQTNVADYLNRPHGIAFLGKDLYVSRAGQFSRAVRGRIIQEDTGAVTRLSDLDGDGRFEYAEDVVAGLPGAQQPDGLHQNNGITFDARGDLYITVGAPTDRGPFTHPYAGTILRARSDGSGLEVFARGFRNPYDIAVGPEGAVFCTDNDANGLDAGDTLHHVGRGEHHGFPYTAADGGLELSGVARPILRTGGTLEGLAYAPPGCLPAGFDDCLYVASFDDGLINRIQIRREAGGDGAVMDFFARVPMAVDVVVSPEEGAVYACSYEQRTIYRITPE